MNEQELPISFSDNYAPVILRLRLDPDNTLVTQLELPPHKHKELGASTFIDCPGFTEFYDRIFFFISELEDSDPSKEEITSEQVWQLEFAQEVVRVGLPEDHLKYLKVLKNHIIGARKIALTIITEDFYLDRIPWELVGHPKLKQLVDTLSTITVSRGVNYELERSVEENTDLKIVLASSSPLDKYSPNYVKEFRVINERFSERRKNNYAPVEVIDCAEVNYIAFIQKLEKYRPQVVHLAMHGYSDALSFQLDKGHEPIPFNSIIDDICKLKSVQVVILSVCYSAQPRREAKSLTRSLVERGIPSAIGMATVITPRTSFVFSNRLYTELSSGKSIVEAYDRAIDSLRNYPEFEQLLWSTPILYYSQNVTPFPQMVARSRQLKEELILPQDIFQDALDVFQKFRVVFQNILPNTNWDHNDWKTETIAIEYILPSLKEALDGFRDLPNTHNIERFPWIYRLRDEQKEAKNLLRKFERNWRKLLTKTSQHSPTSIERFAGRGKELITKFDQITSLLSTNGSL